MRKINLYIGKEIEWGIYDPNIPIYDKKILIKNAYTIILLLLLKLRIIK
ncbi:hypothetical protein [Campylobacter fetus]|nr:hypothetical protein [Campylobacter fetus]